MSNCILSDELGFVTNAEEFYEAIYPVLSSSDTTKMIITSTPQGLNFFYKMWVEAERGENGYIAYDVKWYEHPDRDQSWYDVQVRAMNPKSVQQEIHCVSHDTIINTDSLGNIEIGSLYNKHVTKCDIGNIVYINEKV